jgi:hypothetical protein
MVVITAAAFQSGLNLMGVIGVAGATCALPGLVYKRFRWITTRFGVPLKFKTPVVSALIIAGTVGVALLGLSGPLLATLASLIVGNLLLGLARLFLNASAHVSVLTFGALWWMATFGAGFTWLLLLTPLMAYSRTSLGQHTLAQVVVGAVIGAGTFGFFFGLSNPIRIF